MKSDLFFQAEKDLEKQLKQANRVLKIAPIALNNYRRELSNPYLPADDNISIELLDSLINDNVITKDDVSTIYKYKTGKLTLKRLEADSIKYQLRKNYYLNLDYNDKLITGDNSDNFEDTIYGNNILNNNTEKLYHGTKVSGSIIGLNDKIVKSDLDINKNLLKIMPICIASNGDEHDKDMYLGIKYAVNQGAKIINISTGKEYSLYNDKVQEAIKYAEGKIFLIVVSAGNNALNLDFENNHYYPNDIDSNGKEIFDNLIRVGASGYSINKSLKAPFSNYGKENVDVFAPGIEIYTTSSTSENVYEIARETSHATPIVSRIAALLFSYYPSLTASEVKQILIDSSVKYDILVDVPTKENPEQQLLFNELSKSGGIVNAYNAMLMAEEFVKGKNKK